MKWAKSYAQGDSAEKRFATTLYKCIFATTHENIHEHWDVRDEEFKYDVKAMKRWNRGDSEPTDRIHYIELKNVQGNKGWLYGDADYIAFETRAHWVLVNRPRLQEWTDSIDKPVSNKKEIYKLYSRPGRADVMTIVPTMDLIAISDKIVKK
jgi:hypothetical protein